MNPLIISAMGLKVPLLFLWKDGFGIKQPKKVDMSFNNKTNKIWKQSSKSLTDTAFS